MTRLSVNVNKIALLRNARRTGVPDLLSMTQRIIDAGAPGITVHPRSDERHITLDDVLALADLPAIANGDVEFNIEGDLRADLLRLVRAVSPTQFTAVPTRPGELTSDRGWRVYHDLERLEQTRRALGPDIRFSIFADPVPAAVDIARNCGADSIEFYTGDYAAGYARHAASQAITDLTAVADLARKSGFFIHAGHDLDLQNLPLLVQAMRPDELSIGHAFTADALIYGLAGTVEHYMTCIRNALRENAEGIEDLADERPRLGTKNPRMAREPGRQ